MKSKFMSIPQFSNKYGIKRDKLYRLAMTDTSGCITVGSNGRHQINTRCKLARELIKGVR